MWKVNIKRKQERKIAVLPENVQDIFEDLKTDLQLKGPEQPEWSNYSKLGKDQYHCHLNYHYVACWTVNDGKNLILEVYYVGSRERAPY